MELITVKNLSSRVHNEINWQLKQGDIHCIIGPSGEGKSMFLKILLGLERYTSGTIVDAENRLWLASNYDIGVQLQDGGLLTDLTIGENIMLPLLFNHKINPEYAKYIVLSYLAKVELEIDVFNKYPAECSGGMQKRAALARAMILNPKILFLDEPTAALDHITADTYYKLLRNFKNITIVMVMHDLIQVKKLAHSVTVFCDSKAYTGTLETLANSDNINVRKFLENV